VINPGWMEQYYTDYASKLKATIPADKLESALKDLQAQKEIFSNPFLQFLLMALTVFIIGLIVTIISSLTLKKVKK
jgi:F0F1-type ATP synthase membrane subunit c/vacuolar-type H+-ATPase subunit K